MKCKNCLKEIFQTPGKREKKYCSDLCRSTFNQRKKAKTVSIPIEEWNKIQKTLKTLEENSLYISGKPQLHKEVEKINITGTVPQGLGWEEKLEWLKQQRKLKNNDKISR